MHFSKWHLHVSSLFCLHSNYTHLHFWGLLIVCCHTRTLNTHQPWVTLNDNYTLNYLWPFKTHSLALSPSLASKCLSVFNTSMIFLLSFIVFTQMLMNIFEEQSTMNEHNLSLGAWTYTILRLFEEHLH